MKSKLGDRIVIIGCPGSGKSTLSRQLHSKTGIPLYHLDNIWWKKDRSHICRDDFDNELQSIMKNDRWIIDGDYSRTYEIRFIHCDTVIFLDYDTDICLKGIKERLSTERSDMPWIEDRLDKDLINQVNNYHKNNRVMIYNLIEKYKDKQILIFSSRNETDEWISNL